MAYLLRWKQEFLFLCTLACLFRRRSSFVNHLSSIFIHALFVLADDETCVDGDDVDRERSPAKYVSWRPAHSVGSVGSVGSVSSRAAGQGRTDNN